MLELEVVVVVIGLRSEADLLDDDLDALSLLFLLLLLKLEDELLVVDDATYWRIDIGEISTRSSSWSLAIRRACCIVYTPCSTLSPTRRTSFTRIASLMRYWNFCLLSTAIQYVLIVCLASEVDYLASACQALS